MEKKEIFLLILVEKKNISLEEEYISFIQFFLPIISNYFKLKMNKIFKL